MNKLLIGALGTTILAQVAFAQEAPMPPLRTDQIAYRSLYKELVETNTTLSVGSCTLAAQKLVPHLKSAGYTDAEVKLFSVPDHPKEGGLTAFLQGTSKT